MSFDQSLKTGVNFSLKKNKVIKKILILVFLGLINGGCVMQESYKILINGELEIITNTSQKICFKPKFDTARTADDNELYQNLEYIIEGYYVLVDRTTVESNMSPIFVHKMQNNEVIKDNSEHCISLISNSIHLKNNNTYDISISGKNEKGEHLVTFSKEFVYKPEQ